MSILETIKAAFYSLKAHKMRTILTMISIIIGVGSVITVVAVGQAGESALKSQFTGGSNTIKLVYMPTEEEVEQNNNISYEDAFTSDDIALIKDIPEVEKVIATSSKSTNIRYREKTSYNTAQ